MFKLGTIAMTRGVADLELSPAALALLLSRHMSGDWGDLGAEDAAANDAAVEQGGRIFSVYKLTAVDLGADSLATEITIWVITEADRSVTTLLLPEEY